MEFVGQDSSTLADLTAEVVAAYVANNQLPVASLPGVIASTYAAIAEMRRKTSASVVEAPLVPAVPIKKSVTPDYLICLDDGKRLKFLRRHLTNLGMTPDQYRRKWNLPFDYPMVAPTYAARRSEIALGFGFGRKKVEPVAKAGGSKLARVAKAASPRIR